MGPLFVPSPRRPIIRSQFPTGAGSRRYRIPSGRCSASGFDPRCSAPSTPLSFWTLDRGRPAHVPKHSSQPPRPRARRLSPVKAPGCDDTLFTPHTPRARSSARVRRELFEARHRLHGASLERDVSIHSSAVFQFSMSTRVSVDSHSSTDPVHRLSERTSRFLELLPSLGSHRFPRAHGGRSGSSGASPRR